MAYLDYNGLSTVRNLIDNLYVRADEFNDDVRDRINWELDPIDGSIDWCDSIAADETAKTAWEGMLSSLSERVEVITPDRITGLALMLYIPILIDHRANLVWMNGSELEFSTLQASINTQTNTIIVYACGRSTMAYGVAGVDDSWTIEELPDDTTYELPPATASTLGGVKVGNGLSVTSDGTLSPNLDYAASPTSGGNAIKSNGILYGAVDSTSTSTVFTATVEGLDSLYDGACVMLHNGVVTSAKYFTININGLGAKKCYSNMTNATRETTIFNANYTLMFVYSTALDSGNGGWWVYRGYNSDTNTIGYQLRTQSTVRNVSDTARYYKLYFTSADGTTWVPASVNSTNNATSARPVNQRPIDPFGRIVYTSSSTSYAAGASLAATTIWDQYTFSLGYSFNRTGDALALTAERPVYLKCATQADGSAIMDANEPIVQQLPTTKDGKIYIFLGIAYSATNIELVPHHPVYWHDGTGIRLWTGAESIVANGSVTTAKLADYAVTSDKLATGAVTRNEISSSLYNELSDIDYVATDATTQAVMANAGKTAVTLAPNVFVNSGESDNSRTRLCWFTMANGLEVAPIGYAADLQGVLTFYARGLHTMASGTMNDTAWTITALPTDADGVSY